jgi:hypothetical protein
LVFCLLLTSSLARFFALWTDNPDGKTKFCINANLIARHFHCAAHITLWHTIRIVRLVSRREYTLSQGDIRQLN